MRKSQRDKRNYLIIGLCAVLVVMAVGFAAFSQQLQINGTSNITSSWNVKITNIERLSASTGVSDAAGSPTYDNSNGLTATFSTNLVSPGDYATYKIKVENLGSLNAVLSSIDLNADSSNDITYYVNKNQNNEDITDTDRLIKENDVLNPTGDSNNLDEGYVYVTVKYNLYDNQVSPTGDDKTVRATVKLNFVQSNSEATPPVPATRTAAEVVEMMGVTTVTTGSGLYNNGDGTYTYKGRNPANYLSFAGSTWRILGIDSTGIKIISDEGIDLTGYSGVNSSDSLKGRFDGQGLRDSSSNGAGGTYCSRSSDGCNIWSKDYTPSGDYTNGFITGTVLLDSELKTYLNGTYYTSVLGSNSNIVEGTYNVGPYNNESSYTWTGKVALLTAPEYNAAGGSSSYLKKPYDWWLLSPGANAAINVLHVSSGGDFRSYNATSFTGVRPVLYLSSNITLTGTGTDSSNAFTIS